MRVASVVLLLALFLLVPGVAAEVTTPSAMDGPGHVAPVWVGPETDGLYLYVHDPLAISLTPVPIWSGGEKYELGGILCQLPELADVPCVDLVP